MKGVVGMLTLVVIVAAHGARVQPLVAATSAAFHQCQEGCTVFQEPAGAEGDEQLAIAVASEESAAAPGEIPASDITGPGHQCFLCGIEELREQVSLGGMAPRHGPAITVQLFDPTGWTAPYGYQTRKTRS